MTWIMSALTVAMLWLAGNRNPLAWRIGLLNQVLWGAFILTTPAYGLIPMWIAITFTHARNLWTASRKGSDLPPANCPEAS